MKISANFDEVDKSLEKAIAEIERKLTNMVRSYAQTMIYRFTENNPVGDPVKYASWYRTRYLTEGLLPEEGFSRGSWQASSSGAFTRVERYGQNTGAQAVGAVPVSMQSYRLGQTFYIGNEGPYIQIINARYSIVPASMKDIMNAYQVDLKTAFNKG